MMPERFKTSSGVGYRAASVEAGTGAGAGEDVGEELLGRILAEAKPEPEPETEPEPEPEREEEYFTLPLEQALQVAGQVAVTVTASVQRVPAEEAQHRIVPLTLPAVILQLFNPDGKVPLIKGGPRLEDMGQRALVNRLTLIAYEVLNFVVAVLGRKGLLRRRRRAGAEAGTEGEAAGLQCPACGREEAYPQGENFYVCRSCGYEFELQTQPSPSQGQAP